MILIGENVHIISKSVRTALENRDENFIKNLIKIQQNMDAIDLNVGPAKGKLDNIFQWLCPLVQDKNISFDSSNIQAIEQGLEICAKSGDFINSTSADNEKLSKLTDLAIKYDCNLIALSMAKEIGIPKTSDGRLELVFEIFEKSLERGLNSEKLFFDPLVLPVKIDQSQAIEAINTIKMVKESFDKPVNTIVGLSNVSNGMPKDLRPLINRVFGVLCFGSGLDAAIVDANDLELVRIFKMLDCGIAQTKYDNLYINLVNMIQCFGELEDIDYDKNDKSQCDIMKAAAVILGKTVYSDSFTQI